MISNHTIMNLTSPWFWNGTGPWLGDPEALPERNLMALCMLAVPAITLFGNGLVCLSVYKEKTLRTATNYFVVSLAVADILVALLVMPIAVYVEINNGVWDLGDRLCDAWVAFDVMCCTASILNLTSISVDRCIAVTRPIQYAKYPSCRRIVVTLILTWIISICVSSPVLFGLNYTPRRLEKPTICTFYNSNYIIFSSLASFYIPCIIIVVLYTKIFIEIRSREKKSVSGAKKRRRQSTAAFGQPITSGTRSNLTQGTIIERSKAVEGCTGQSWATTGCVEDTINTGFEEGVHEEASARGGRRNFGCDVTVNYDAVQSSRIYSEPSCVECRTIKAGISQTFCETNIIIPGGNFIENQRTESGRKYSGKSSEIYDDAVKFGNRAEVCEELERKYSKKEAPAKFTTYTPEAGDECCCIGYENPAISYSFTQDDDLIVKRIDKDISVDFNDDCLIVNKIADDTASLRRHSYIVPSRLRHKPERFFANSSVDEGYRSCFYGSNYSSVDIGEAINYPEQSDQVALRSYSYKEPGSNEIVLNSRNFLAVPEINLTNAQGKAVRQAGESVENKNISNMGSSILFRENERFQDQEIKVIEQLSPVRRSSRISREIYFNSLEQKQNSVSVNSEQMSSDEEMTEKHSTLILLNNISERNSNTDFIIKFAMGENEQRRRVGSRNSYEMRQSELERKLSSKSKHKVSTDDGVWLHKSNSQKENSTKKGNSGHKETSEYNLEFKKETTKNEQNYKKNEVQDQEVEQEQILQQSQHHGIYQQNHTRKSANQQLSGTENIIRKSFPAPGGGPPRNPRVGELVQASMSISTSTEVEPEAVSSKKSAENVNGVVEGKKKRLDRESRVTAFRTRSRSAKRERKVTKTLAAVLGAFLICWVPFFVINIVNAVCIRHDLHDLDLCNLEPNTLSFIVWLGYINSFLNPIIYTVFNSDFRRAFRRILLRPLQC